MIPVRTRFHAVTTYVQLAVSHADARNKSLSDLYRYSAQGIPAVYETQDMKRILHAVLLSNLSSDTVYYFRAGYGIEQSRFSPEKVPLPPSWDKVVLTCHPTFSASSPVHLV